MLLRREGNAFVTAAFANREHPAGGVLDTPEVVPIDPAANFPSRVFASKAMLHIPDWLAIDLPPHERRVHERSGLRSSLMLPVLCQGECIGVLAVAHNSAHAYSDDEDRAGGSFVDQAVIAVENVRLFNETREALERQTATADVLKVISESPTDVQPVFDVIAERAARLTGADYGWVFRFDGELLHVASCYGVNAAGIEAARRSFPMPPGGGSASARAVRDGEVVNIGDVRDEDDVQYKVKSIADLAGYRSILAVPMRQNDQIVGVVTVTRAAPGVFPDKEVALLQTFARQAVIAIENVRLVNETKEALEQQTATAEVLQVISSRWPIPSPCSRRSSTAASA